MLQPQPDAGKVRILAVINAARSTVAPTIPTVAELGFPGYAAGVWSGLFAPGGAPQPVIARLAADFAKVMALPDLNTTFNKVGIEVIAMPLDEFGRFVSDDLKRWGPVVKAANIKVD